MLGLTQNQVIFGMTLTKSLTFVIPAIFIALITGVLIIGKLEKKLYLDDIGEEIIGIWPIIQALAIGIVLPVLSSVKPIMETMKINLQESLNFSRSKVKAIYITILNKSQRIKEQFLPYLCLGTLCVVYGFTVYYLLPLSLISLDLGLLL